VGEGEAQLLMGDQQQQPLMRRGVPTTVSRCRPAQVPPAGTTCIICLEGTNTAAQPLWRDCACRGSAGWVHPVPCLVGAAKQKVETWDTCPTCKQRWTGNTQLTLAKEHLRHVESNGLAGDAAERIRVCDNLAMALDEVAGDPCGALEMFQESLRLEELLHGRDHPDALATKNNIGTLQMRTGNYRDALTTFQQTLTIERRRLGESHDNTLHACEQLALAHASLEQFDTAIPLMRQAVRTRMRKLGKDADQDPVTLIGLGNLGNMLAENKVRSSNDCDPLLCMPHYGSGVQRCVCWC
jgi:hypothetical protein